MNYNHMKGQIWSLDVIFSIVIFSFTITLLALTWLHVSNSLSINYGGTSDIMSAQEKAFSYSLMSPGSPADCVSIINTTNSSTWASVTPGLITGQAISPSKLYAFESMVNNNYTAVKVSFGITYDYYITIKGASGSPGNLNISIGRNPSNLNSTSVFVNKVSSRLDGIPVTVSILLWTNSTEAIG